MHDIFLSYSKEDKSIAKKIALGLENNGFKVWWDIEIPTGHTWDSEIEKAIENCKCVVVLWSKASINSEWVRIEAAEGKKKNILIPVRIEEVEPPLAFRRRQYINLTGWSKKTSDFKFRKLVEDIKLIIGNENYRQVENSKLESKPRLGTLKKYLKYLWLIPIIITIVTLTFAIKSIIKLSGSNTDVAKIKPIDFNVKKDTLTLVFHSKTLKRKDTFAIEHHKSITFLKAAIERHYNFTIPAKFATEIANGGSVNSYLVADHRLLRDESLSLKNAGLKDFDIIEFDYKLFLN